MKRFTLFGFLLALLLPFLSLQAENYQKYIVSRPALGGMLYFMTPSKVDLLPGQSHQRGALIFDVTYLSSRDSLTFNCSLSLGQPSSVDSLTLLTGAGMRQSFPAERLYLEPRGSRWELRLSIKLPYTFWHAALQEVSPLQLFFTQGGTPMVGYRFSPKVWKRQQGIYQLLHQMKTY